MKIDTLAKLVLTAGGTIAIAALVRYLEASGAGLPPLTSPTYWGPAPIVFAGLAAIFYGSLGFGPASRMAVAAVSVSLLAVLYASELVLATTALGPAANAPFWSIDRGRSPQRKKEIARLAAKSGATIDTRDRGELLDDSRKQGIDMVQAVMLADLLDDYRGATSRESTNASELLPLSGISNTLTLLCNESGQFVSYASDEHGFRNPRGIWNSVRADIAAVGQSLTQGYCVPDGKGFVDLLRTHNRVVLNLGTSGESSLLQLAAINEYLPRYKPRIVLWFFTEGIDLPDLYTESTHPLLMRYLEPTFSQRLLTRQPEIDAALRRTVSELETRGRQSLATASSSTLIERSLGILKLWSLREKVDLVLGVNNDDPKVWSMLEQTSHNLLSTALAQARTVTSTWGGTLYFVYLPSWTRYRNWPRAAEREHTKVLSLVNALGISVIDVQPAFQAQHDPLSLFPFRRFGHYNERGNQVVAETVVHALSIP